MRLSKTGKSVRIDLPNGRTVHFGPDGRAFAFDGSTPLGEPSPDDLRAALALWVSLAKARGAP